MALITGFTSDEKWRIDGRRILSCRIASSCLTCGNLSAAKLFPIAFPAMKISTLFALLGFLLSAAPGFAQTDIRDEFGGKRILYIDGKSVRPDPAGARLLYIDGDNIRPDPNGKRLLFVDHDGNVRPDPAGVRLAIWVGTELRKDPP